MAPSTRRTAQPTPVPQSIQTSDFDVPSDDEDVLSAEAIQPAAAAQHGNMDEEEVEAADDAAMEDVEAEEDDVEEEIDPGKLTSSATLCPAVTAKSSHAGRKATRASSKPQFNPRYSSGFP